MYTDDQLRKIIDKILVNLPIEEGYDVAMTEDETEDLLKMINSRKRTDSNLKQFISSFIYNHAIYMEAGSNALEYNLIRKAAIRQYAHNLNLKYIKNEIYYRYDIQGGKMIMYRWHNKDGLYIDTLVEELKEIGIYIKSEIESEIFNEFLDCLEAYKPTIVKEVLDKEHIQSVVDSTFEKMKNELENTNNETKENMNNEDKKENDPLFDNIDDELFS